MMLRRRITWSLAFVALGTWAGCGIDDAGEENGNKVEIGSEAPTGLVPAAPSPSGGRYVVMQRPPSVPAHFVATPNGWFDPACVIELAADEHEAKDGSIVGADGAVHRAAKHCTSPRYDARGKIVAPAEKGSASNPVINNTWIERLESSSLGAMSFVHAQWTVPAAPVHDTGQVLYFFPGLQDLPSTRILQPVLGWHQGGGGPGAWTLESWNCCVDGTTTHSGSIPAVAGSTVSGDMQGTNCNTLTGVCTNWSIVSRNAAGASVTLNTTVSTAMSWIAGHAFEVYGIDTCDELPPNGSSVISGFVFRDVFGINRATPQWRDVVDDETPACLFGASHTASTGTLTWGGLSGGFWGQEQRYNEAPELHFGLPSTWKTATGDFNGEGRGDYARLGGTGSWIFFGNADGTFTRRFQAYAGLDFSEDSPWDTITGDFNGDGLGDYARLGGTGAWVFFGKSEGSFDTGFQDYAGLSFGLPSTWQVVTGDWNGDHRTDYVRLGGTGAWIYFGNANGTFTRGFQSYPGLDFSEDSPWDSISGDFNGDGLGDYARLGSTGAFVYFGNTNGMFTSTFQSYVNESPALSFGLPSTWQEVTGDWNGDHRTDYARLGGTGAWIFFGNANGTFTRGFQSYPTLDFGEDSPWQSIAGDWNGDGRGDYARLGSDGAFVYTGNTNGTFTVTFQSYGPGRLFGLPSPWQAVTGDFDGDGHGDYARLGDTGAFVFLHD
jgi:hypothetical protein